MDAESPATRSQPAPQRNERSREVVPLVAEDLRLRVEMGNLSYGQPLLSHDGRDSLVDAYQEALDLALYLRKMLLERDGA